MQRTRGISRCYARRLRSLVHTSVVTPARSLSVPYRASLSLGAGPCCRRFANTASEAKKPLLSTVSSVEQVVNPRSLTPPSSLLDTLHALSPISRYRLESLLSLINTKNETVIVLLAAVADTEPQSPKIREFAKNLFNHWGVGDKESNNGILILVLDGARRIEIITGRGICDNDWFANTVIQKLMAPELRNNDYSQALENALIAINDRTKHWSTTRSHTHTPSDNENNGRTMRLDASHAPRPYKPIRSQYETQFQARMEALQARTNTTTNNNYNTWFRPLLLFVVGVVIVRAIARSRDSDSDSESSNETLSVDGGALTTTETRRCPRCDGRLKLIGIATNKNLRPSLPSLSRDAQQPQGAADDELDTSAGLMDVDYAVDFATMVESLTVEQRQSLRQGHSFSMKLCSDCNNLIVQQRHRHHTEGDRPYHGEREIYGQPIPVPIIVRPPSSSPLSSRSTIASPSYTPAQPSRSVSHLPPEKVISVKGVDVTHRPPFDSGSSVGTGSNFGGGSSGGGGGGGSW